MINNDSLKSFSYWVSLVGIVTIISGALSAIIGVFAFVIGAIPGVITIILGVKLIRAKNITSELIFTNNEEEYSIKLNNLIMQITGYFKIQGILIIVMLIAAAFSLLFGFAAIARLITTM